MDSTTEFILMPLLNFVISLLVTAFIYLLIPVIIVIQKRKLLKKTLKKITVFNAIGCFIIFTIINLALGGNEFANIAATFLWSSIGYAILKSKACIENDDEPSQDGIRDEPVESDENEEDTDSASVVITPEPAPVTQNTSGQVIKCRKCGYESEMLFNSCPECGSYAKDYVQHQEEPTNPQSRICRKCGEDLPPDSTYCHKCGAKNSSFSDSIRKKLNKKTIIILTSLIVIIAIAIPTIIYFSKDTCYVYNCSNICSGKYCYIHCCGVADCDILREDSSRYCYKHICSKYGCTNRKSEGSNYCADHADSYNTSNKTADEIIAERNSKKSTTRKTYEELKSEYKAGNYIIEDETDKQTTSADTCRSAGCDNVVDSYDDYCNEHKCYDDSCNFEKDYGSNYCYFHSCNTFGCENRKDGYHQYCVEHTCVENGCTREKSYNSNYCSSHGCRETGCDNGISGSGRYCYEHTCIESGCNNQKSVISDYYCYLHDD